MQTDGVTLYADQAAAGGARVSTEPEVDCTLRSSALCTVCTQRRGERRRRGSRGSWDRTARASRP